MKSRRWLVLLVQNWRLAAIGLGAWLLWRGLAAWSEPLASVVLGMVLVALAIVPSLTTRKDRS